MSTFMKMSDEEFKKAKPIPLTHKQMRTIKRKPKKGDHNDPLMLFWKAVSENTGTDITKINVSNYIVTDNLYAILEDLVTEWVLKQRSYLSRGSRALANAVGGHMLLYVPSDYNHPKMKDNVVYYLKDRK